MLDNSHHQDILAAIPHRTPFRFIDEIIQVNENKCIGTYRFKKEEFTWTFPRNADYSKRYFGGDDGANRLIPLGIVNLLKENQNKISYQIKPIFTD